MTEHYSRSTVSVSAWCHRCGKPTEHAMKDTRLGACLQQPMETHGTSIVMSNCSCTGALRRKLPTGLSATGHTARAQVQIRRCPHAKGCRVALLAMWPSR